MLGSNCQDLYDFTIRTYTSENMNQASVFSLAHHHSDLPEISFLFLPALTPVDVSAMLQLSLSDTARPSAVRGPVESPP